MVLINCDCGNDTFNINWWPPNNAEAICTECEYSVELGAESKLEA
jgi:hypothetical protein